MAAIDFPASPTVGQTFAAGNGVVYTWSGTVWLASGASAGGDFSAYHAPGDFALASGVVLVPSTAVIGNSGSWYSTSTGRYTPPAGRYSISGGLSALNSGAAFNCILAVRKNGVVVASQQETSSGVNALINPTVAINVDANGTDYFELFATPNVASTGRYVVFSAFPVSGIKGPPGDPGQLGFRLLQRTVVSSAVADVSIQNIPSDINDVMIQFDLLPVTNQVDLYLQMYDSGGVLDSTAGHYFWAVAGTYNQIPGGTAPLCYSSSGSGLGTGIVLNAPVNTARVHNGSVSGGIKGRANMANIRETARGFKGVDFQSNYVDDAITYSRFMTGSGHRVTTGSITGLRLVFGTGNIASGTFSVWGSP